MDREDDPGAAVEAVETDTAGTGPLPPPPESGITAGDEHPHDPGDDPTYNESMYVNAFDAAQGTGGWFRVGNRVNEGYAEVSACTYLPDGRVGFMFSRPSITTNDRLAAAGLEIEVVEPFAHLRVTYDGPLLLLEDPTEMVDPRAAFASNPTVDARVDLDVLAAAPAHGGRAGEEGALAGFAAAHYEQHVTATGELTVGDVEVELDGLGLRDKSWGPRTWQAVRWYRWLPMTFGPGFAATPVLLARDGHDTTVGGVVLRDGVLEQVRAIDLDTTWDDDLLPVRVEARLTTDVDDYEVFGEVVSVVPLRNLRTGPDGIERHTRITEAMTRWTCRGSTSLGMAEHLDQLVDGVPVGIHTP